MRILVVSGSDISRIGGVLVGIRESARRLVAMGDHCTVLSINPGGLPKEDWIDGIHIIRVNSPISKCFLEVSPEVGRRFMSLVRTPPTPDIIHLHGYATLLSHEIAFLCKLWGMRYIYTPHYSPFAHIHPLGGLLFKMGRPAGSMIFNSAERVICISKFESDMVRKHFGIPLEKISIVPNGVEFIDHGNESCRIKNETKKIRLLYVGYLMKLKGIQFILKAIQKLVIETKLDVELLVAGSGYYEPVLRKLVTRLEIEKNVKWLGDVRGNDLKKLYRGADISLLLSASENFGTVVAESLAAGTPTIVTTNSALAEFVKEPGCYGIAYPPDIGKLAGLIVDVHRDGKRTGPFSKKIMTWDEVAVNYEMLFKESLDRRTDGDTYSNRS
jgi:glycosyltransferase involved in cell wall biosynthesis